MLHVSKCRFDRTEAEGGRMERGREREGGRGGIIGLDLLKKKKNQPNYPTSYCSAVSCEYS